MKSFKGTVTRRILLSAALAASGASAFQFPSCEAITSFVDPCGTILGNCAPGAFDLLFADVPDYAVDPTCTIPGRCTDQAGGAGVAVLPQQFISPFASVGGP